MYHEACSPRLKGLCQEVKSRKPLRGVSPQVPMRISHIWGAVLSAKSHVSTKRVVLGSF